MSLPAPIRNDGTRPLAFTVRGESPHVFAYRFWQRLPGAERWDVIAQGQTADNAVDAFETGPLPDGSGIAYWISVSGHGLSPYRVRVTIAQAGATVEGGDRLHAGTTSARGGAVQEHELVLT